MSKCLPQNDLDSRGLIERLGRDCHRGGRISRCIITTGHAKTIVRKEGYPILHVLATKLGGRIALLWLLQTYMIGKQPDDRHCHGNVRYRTRQTWSSDLYLPSL